MRIGRPTLPPGALSAVLLGVAVFLSVVAGVGVTVLAEPGDGGMVHIRLLGVNDFHGHLEPTDGLGGAAYLGSHLDRAAASGPRATIRVHAGDMVGASPLISSHFPSRPRL
jgi:5'-nucleotidase